MRKTYAAKLRNVLSASIASGRLAEDLNELTREELAFIAHDWEIWARDEQLAPCSTSSGASGLPAKAGISERESEAPIKNWRVWLALGGRGSGKTRAGAEWVRSIVGDDKQARIALVGKTLGDVRNVMVEGQSGLLAIHPAHERPEFEPSKRRLTWPNGAIAELFSADEAEALRGPQFTAAWCDELAKWRGAEKAWDMLQFALRLGDAPRVCVTTTPRNTKLLKQIIADEATVTVNLATADNATNLAPTFLAEMTRRYAGSAIGRQELLGEIVEDASDGLWRRHWFEEGRVAHVGRFDALEDQMCAFGADGTMRGRSPDRADALVWAITDLLLEDTSKPSVRML